MFHDDTAAQLLACVDAGIVGKNWILMQFHDFVDPAVSTSACTPTVFDAFCAGIASRVAAGTLLLRTPQEVLQDGAI